MKRIVVLSALAFALGTLTAEAVEIKVLGFSADGRYFALQEKGTEGAASYSLITPIEVEGNRTIKGAQISYSSDDRKRATAVRRANNRLMRKLKLVTRGVMSISTSGLPAEPFEDAALKSLALPRSWFGPESWLVLRELKLVTQRCGKTTTNPTGFGLSLQRKAKPDIRLSQDVIVPTARGCPAHYRIAEAHALRLKDGDVVLAAIIQYVTSGTETPEEPFTAVTVRIPRS
jgi:predicted secreted protein